MIAQIDLLLCRWGRWSIKRDSSALGYGSVSPMFRDAPSGGGWGRGSDPGFTEADVIACDGAVMALPVVQRVIVILHYQRQDSLRATARECGVSKEAAGRYLAQAHHSIRDHLTRSEISPQ